MYNYHSSSDGGKVYNSESIVAGDYAITVGDHSCIGDFACAILKETSIVGDGSCNGDKACYKLGPATNIEDFSCNATYACLGASGNTIGPYACNGLATGPDGICDFTTADYGPGEKNV